MKHIRPMARDVVAEVIADLRTEPATVTEILALAIRARRHAEMMAHDPAAAKLFAFAEALEARALAAIDAAAAQSG